MYNKYAYWIFRNKLSVKERDKIKRIGKKSGYGDALTREFYSPDRQNFQKKLRVLKVRDTDVVFSSDPFLYDLFVPLVHSANNQGGWRYDLDWFEPVQLAKYKKSQHYSWHLDGASDHFGSYTEGENFKGNVRKLSLVACLSDANEGGNLELALQEQDKENEILNPEMKAGDVIVFPSYTFHRSTSVEKGVKYSASMWCLGPPFK